MRGVAASPKTTHEDCAGGGGSDWGTTPFGLPLKARPVALHECTMHGEGIATLACNRRQDIVAKASVRADASYPSGISQQETLEACHGLVVTSDRRGNLKRRRSANGW